MFGAISTASVNQIKSMGYVQKIKLLTLSYDGLAKRTTSLSTFNPIAQ